MRQDDIVDVEEGYVFDSLAQENPNPVWGLMPGPGIAEAFIYPNCEDGRMVADVVRIEKGHTEGLEPEVTQYLLSLMTSVPTGKLASSAG